jgi:competence protein ComEC
MLLIGAPIPSQRAVIMFGIVVLAIMLDRDPFSLRLAAFAAVLLFILTPESLVGPSFQLSFAAVICLIAFYDATREWWRKNYERQSLPRKLSMFVVGCLATTAVATLATAPFALYYFHRVPLFSGLVANMIAVPVTSFVTIPFGVLGCLLMPLGLEKWPLRVTEWSIDIVMDTAREVITWPHMVFYAAGWPWYLLLIISLGGLWFCIWRGKIRWPGLALALMAMSLIPFTPQADILISSDGRLMAVRDTAGVLWVSSRRINSFEREAWQEQEGGRDIAFWPSSGTADDSGFLRCDSLGCVYQIKGKTVSFIKSAVALEEDCRRADIVIMPGGSLSKESCRGAETLIDKWDIRDNGAYAIFLSENTAPVIRTANGERGARPWTVRVQ